MLRPCYHINYYKPEILPAINYYKPEILPAMNYYNIDKEYNFADNLGLSLGLIFNNSNCDKYIQKNTTYISNDFAM